VRNLKAVALGVVLVTLLAAPASADGFFTPFYGYNFGGDSANCPKLTTCEEKRANFGASFGSMGTVFGFEEDISFAKNFFGTIANVDNSVFTAMSNLMLGVGRGPVQPYVLAGAGLIRTHTSLNVTKFDANGNSFGYDIGVGVNAYPTAHVGVRGDVRHFHTLQDLPLIGSVTNEVFVNQKLDFWRASVGLSLRF
jgi:opacity protein-like surface antigen